MTKLRMIPKLSPDVIPLSNGVRKVPDDSETYKHTIVWTRADWKRIEAAAQLISEDAAVEVKIPAFIRGAVLRRCDEVLGIAA